MKITYLLSKFIKLIHIPAIRNTNIDSTSKISSSSLVVNSKINNGAVIGMCTVLTKDVDPYEMWARNLGKFIKKRFDPEIIEKLLYLKWWNFNKLNYYSKFMNNTKFFLENIKYD